MNRDNFRNGGGIGVLIRDEITSKVTIHREDQMSELLWLRIGGTKSPLFLAVFYGKQEDVSIECIEDVYFEIQTELERVKTFSNQILIIGDFNSKIYEQDGTIEANSRNGTILKRFIQSNSFVVQNFTDKCRGKWTRQNTGCNLKENAILDYVISSEDYSQFIDSMFIYDDGQHKLTGKRPTDHNTIEIILSISEMTVAKQKTWKWKITPKTDWNKYAEYYVDNKHLITGEMGKHETVDEKSEFLIKTLLTSAERNIGKIEFKEEKNPLYRSNTVKSALKDKRDARKLYHTAIALKNEAEIKIRLEDYIKHQEIVREALKEGEKEQANRKLEKFIEGGKKDYTTIWRLRKTVLKDEKSPFFALKDKEGKRVFDPEKIKIETADYFENLYKVHTGDEFDKDWTNIITNKVEKLTEIRNQEDEKLDINQPITQKEYESAKKQLKNYKSSGADDVMNEFLKHGGKALDEILLVFYNIVFEQETIPSTWKDSTITCLYKGKGDPENLINTRGISLSSNIEKLFERI